MSTDRERPASRRPSPRVLLIASAIAVGVAGLMAAPPIVSAISPRWANREAIAALLKLSLGGYLAGLAIAIPASILLVLAIVRSRRRGGGALRKGRALVACVSFLVGSVLLEAIATVWQSRAHGFSPIAVRSFQEPNPSPASDDELYIVVIGESTSIGIPYDPSLSIGQIVGWQLERVLHGRKVLVDLKGRGGFNLQQSIAALEKIERRPDAILLYAGHNEFQGFYRLSREVDYYSDQINGRTRVTRLLRSTSSLCDLILETLDRRQMDLPPGPPTERRLVDSPACTDEERARIVSAAGSRLELFYGYCERVGALPIVFIPAGNDAGFDPSRSILEASTRPEDRASFETAFRKAIAVEGVDPKGSEVAYRVLLRAQPGFAEAHFRLARLLERAGLFEEANRHYIEARDRDGMPLRCTGDILAALRDVAARHPGIVIEASDVLRRLSPGGILDGRLFLDAHHPNLVGYTALARELLGRLRGRGAFGWPADQPTPAVEPEEVAAHFGLTPARLADVCRRMERWYAAVAPIRFDPTDRLARARAYGGAVAKIEAGIPPDRAGVAGLWRPIPEHGR